MRACIHQPQFIPYLGFFNKVCESDIFVVLDTVKAIRQDFTNKNRIKGPDGEQMLRIPVKNKNVIIKDMMISNNNWIKEHLKSMHHCYAKTKYYTKYSADIIKILELKEWKSVVELDIQLIRWLFEILDIKANIIPASELKINTDKTQRLIDICKAVGADTYLSGMGGKNYMDESLFAKENIKLVFQNFKHPTYNQRFGTFMPNMSILDALFNCGADEVKKMIRGISDENTGNSTTP